VDNITTSKAFVGIGNYIEEKCGIVLNDQNAHLLECRLGSIFNMSQVKNLDELYVKLCVLKNAETLNHVIEAITTNETFWFRDKALWTMLENNFLPEMIKAIKSGDCQKIKIWSSACSFGQEPYSIAMCIDNYLIQQKVDTVGLSDFEIIATDISMTALTIAKRGQYDSVAIARGLDEVYKQKYFHHEGKTWHIADHIRQAVDFRPFNLIEDAYRFEQYDLILCRNVLIYFSRNTKNDIYKRMAYALKSEGALLIGSSELLEDDQAFFSRECVENSVYFKKKLKEGR